MSDHLKPIVEALIFASPEPVTPKTLYKLLDGEPKEDVDAALAAVAGRLRAPWRAAARRDRRRLPDRHAPRAARVGPQAVPRAHDAEAVGAGARDAGGDCLQAAGHRAEIAEIRGVTSSGGVLSTLVDRHLIKTVGRKQVVGRPFMYATTREFLERFGLNDLSDLPKVEEMSDALGFELPMGLAEPTATDEPLPFERPTSRAGCGPHSCHRRRRRKRSGTEVVGVVTSRRRAMPKTVSVRHGRIRLQKILSTAGICVPARGRGSLIVEGRVTVNGRPSPSSAPRRTRTRTTSASTAGASRPPGRRRYILMNKPRGYITTARIPQRRPTVIDLLTKAALREYVYPVGRLDYDSEGLLLLTSDGDLAEKLTHPQPRGRRASITSASAACRTSTSSSGCEVAS